ncbi:hypothetical protein E4U53_001210, partial [Claviceps sorghi]
MTSWDTFTAFNGKLTSSFPKPSLDAQGQPDYAATVSSFWQWMRDLRQTPGDYGIPSAHVPDVERLLDVFFPVTPPHAPMYPTRISSRVGHPASLRVMRPVEVQPNPSKDPLLVADAPSALGYIFSVQGAAAGFDEYMLPLAVCYAWALHLAFLRPCSAPAATATLTNVPAEASLVYCASHPDGASSSSAAPAFCLGATWSGADPADARGAAVQSDDEAEMDRWRRKNMVDPLFAGHANPAAPSPLLGPSLRRILARRLNEYILGKQDNDDDDATPFLRPLFSAGVLSIPAAPGLPGLSQYIQAMGALIKTEGVLFPPVDPEDFVCHTTLGPVLMDHLYSFVDKLHDPVDDPSFAQNVQALVRFYVTPHVLDPVSLKEVPLGPKSKAIVDGLATALPPQLLVAMAQKTRSLWHHLGNGFESSDVAVQRVEARFHIENNMSFTRSAELFALLAV